MANQNEKPGSEVTNALRDLTMQFILQKGKYVENYELGIVWF